MLGDPVSQILPVGVTRVLSLKQTNNFALGLLEIGGLQGALAELTEFPDDGVLLEFLQVHANSISG